MSHLSPLLAVLLLLWSSGAKAGQLEADDLECAVSVLFWPQLYVNGGETLHC